MDEDLTDKPLLDRIRRAEAYFYKRQTLDLAIILTLVVLGSIWSTVIVSFIQQVIFKTDDPHYSWWFLVAVITTIIFVLVIRALKAPVFLFT